MKDLDVTASKLICVSDQVKWFICDVIFVLKEKGEITLLLTVY